MAASDVTGSGAVAKTLFENIAFWLSSTVPQRRRFKELIQQNGGKVVIGENDADYRLVDHRRKDIAPGTYSYQFVERSIQKKALEDPEEYRAGPSVATTRPVGSATVPPRHRRIPFSAKDDQILYDWVKPFEAKGGAFKGNKIYQQLEAQCPHHTAQSWRDRYLKKVRGRSRPVTQGDDAESAPPSTHEEAGLNTSSNGAPTERSTQSAFNRFTTVDKETLLEEANNILGVDPSLEDKAWSEFAKANPQHSANEWKSYFHTVVRPEYVAQQRRRKNSLSIRDGSPVQKTRTVPFTSATSTPKKAKQTRPSEQTQMEKKARDVEQRIEVVVDNRPSEPPSTTQGIQKAADTSLSRKRRHTAVEGANLTVNESHSSPNRKRRATDYIARETASTREEPTRTTMPSRAPASTGRVQQSQRRISNDNTLKDPPEDRLAPHGLNESGVSRRSVSVAASENDQFETAPQFQPDSNRSAAQSQKLAGLEGLQDTSIPGLSARDGDASEDEDAAEDIEQLDDWIASRVRSGKAANELQAMEALQCTTMNPDLADRVLPYLKSGKGIPTDMRGVWTAEDDESIEGPDARDIQRTEKKHGNELTTARFEYLEMRREAMQSRG